MSHPRFEVADVLRLHGTAFFEKHPQSPQVRSALNLIRICRTAALGGHLDCCPACGFERPSYNSCRNRHCPKCQTAAKEQWWRATTTFTDQRQLHLRVIWSIIRLIFIGGNECV